MLLEMATAVKAGRAIDFHSNEFFYNAFRKEMQCC